MMEAETSTEGKRERNTDLLFLQLVSNLERLLEAQGAYSDLLIAAELRKLLLDSNGAINRFNSKRKLKLCFEVADRDLAIGVSSVPEPEFSFRSILPDSSRTQRGTSECNLSEFLKLGLFRTARGDVTVKKLIEILAHRAGGVHFDKHIDDDEEVILSANAKAAIVGLRPSSRAIREVAAATLRAVEPLREAIVGLPEDIEVLAQYECPRGTSVEFGGGHVLEAINIGRKCSALACHSAVALFARECETVFVGLGSRPARHQICMGAGSDGKLFVEAMVDGEITRAASGIDVQSLGGKAFLLGMELVSLGTESALTLFLEGRQIARTKFSGLGGGFALDQLVVGCDLDHSRHFSGEWHASIFCVRPLTPEHRRQVLLRLASGWTGLGS